MQANDLVRKGVIQEAKVFAISTLEADLDMEFSGILNSLDLDITGKLIEWLPLEGECDVYVTELLLTIV